MNYRELEKDQLINILEDIKDENYFLRNTMLKTNIVLSGRINKAIEYIEKQEDYFNEYPLINRQELLDILKGSDKE